MRHFVAIFTVFALLVLTPSAFAQQKGKTKGHHKEKVKKESRKNDRGKIVEVYSERGEYHRRNAMEAAEWHKKRGMHISERARQLQAERKLTQQEWLQAKEQLKQEARAEVQFYKRKAQEANKSGKGESKAFRDRSRAEAKYFREKAKEAAEDYRELRKELNAMRRYENESDRRRFLSFLKEREARHKHLAKESEIREKDLEDWSKVNPGL